MNTIRVGDVYEVLDEDDYDDIRNGDLYMVIEVEPDPYNGHRYRVFMLTGSCTGEIHDWYPHITEHDVLRIGAVA